MGRGDTKADTNLNMSQGFTHKLPYYQNIQQQVKEHSTQPQLNKYTRKTVLSSRYRPSIELYQPPNVRIPDDVTGFTKHTSGNNSRIVQNNMLDVLEAVSQKTNSGEPKVHFQSSENKTSAHRFSALKRSKSFGGTEVIEMAATGFDRNGYPIEYQWLVKKALQDPNSLSSHQLMEVVRVLCNKAVQSVQNAEPAAQMCFTIILKDESGTFLESLLNSCREWYNERDKLLRSYLTSCHSGSNGTGETTKRWTAYIFFLTELFLRFKSLHRNVIQAMPFQVGDRGCYSTPTPAIEDRSLPLMMLIYECCEIILKPPSLNCLAEIECIRSVLTSAGPQLEVDSSQRMYQLISLMRDAFISPSVCARVRKTILELIELHASQWELDLPQTMYYFPYTSMNRK